jgi:hypothetical protein
MSEFESTNEIERIRATMIEAAQIASGEFEPNPLEVFPAQGKAERRADIEWVSGMGEVQEEVFRNTVAQLGPGRMESVGPVERGLRDGEYVAVTEGGQPHKIVAELNMLRASSERPAAYVITGSSGRQIKDNEKAFMAEYTDKDESEIAPTEFGIAKQILEAQEGYQPESSTTIVDYHDTHTVARAGTLDGVPVFTIGIERQYGEDGRYSEIKNPEKMRIAYHLLGREVAFATSATYEPTCFIAAEEAGVPATVVAYGVEELADVKGTDPVLPTIEQLGGELHKVAKKLA